MKSTWSLLFFACTLILFLCACITVRRRTPIALRLRNATYLASIMAASTGIIVVTSSYRIANACFSINSACISWILLFYVEFCILYTGGTLKKSIVQKAVILVLIGDSLLQLANNFFPVTYSIIQKVTKDGLHYFGRTPLFAGKMHLLLCYSLLTYGLFTIIRHMTKIPPFYWAKYILTLLFSILATAWQIMFLSAHSYINFTALGLAIAAPFFAYFSLFYKPHIIIDKMLARTVDKSSDFVFFFDIFHQCIFVNEKAKQFFDIPDDKLNISHEILARWFKGLNFDFDEEPCTFICTQIWHEQLTHLKVTYDKLYQSGTLIGSFFHIHDITGDVNRYEVQEYKATHDDLTGLYTRDYLFQRIHRELLQHPENKYFLIVSDIKDFKMINDIFGRQTGDELLINSARMIREHFKSTALYGRIGYDRFCILLSESQLEAFEKSFHQNRELLSQIPGSSYYPLKVHLGIYPVKERKKPVSVMVDHASLALESVKDSNEINIASYTDAMRRQLLWEQKIVSEQNAALQDRQFEIYLQPQAKADGKIGGAEVLIRWNHPDKGLLVPNEFVPVLEKNGQITRMDLFVWEEACRLLQKWKKAGNTDLYLSVNISPKDFYYIDVHQTFCDLIQKYDIDPALLKLEITETVMITDIEQKIQLIDKLHDSGFSVEMDDFGSGYSSLNMLKSIPVDILKLDMAFLYHAKDVKRSQTIIQQVVVLSKELGIPVITEGVETEEQVQFLRKIGCDMFQGYYFAKPLRVSEFETLYL
ncbi:MAG: bifunctional diguanylate cyclase/phosphodiesterase [Treponema sp.]|nr:bifunctional diguanylate cyclase/phosphodiesterase [Treponema sp.]